MKNVPSALAFAVGIIVGAILLLIAQAHRVESLTSKNLSLKESHQALSEELKKNREDSKKIRSEFEKKMDELIQQLFKKDKEIESLKAENKALREKLNLTEKSPALTKKPDEQKTDETAQEEQKSLIEELKNLLTRIETAPSDRILMRSFTDKIWELKDVAFLKEIVDKFNKIFDEALKNEPDNLDLIFNQGNACAAELTYLQFKMKEDPMRYGPKMGEVSLKALNCFNKVLEKNPNDYEALLTRAYWCYYSPGEIRQAEKDFSELTKRAKEQNFEPVFGERIFLGAAMTYQKLGEKEKAKKSPGDGMRLYPLSDNLRKAYDKLQE